MPHPSAPDPDPAPGLVTIGRAAKKATLGGRTQVIVPVSGDAAALSGQVEALASCRADIVEWRADTFLSSLVGAHFVSASDVGEDLVRMARYVADSSPLPVLATIRTSVEGGQAYLDDEEYCALVRRLTSFAGGVDVEISRDGSSALIEEAHEAGAIVVASFHDFEGTPGDEQLAEVLAAMNYAGADVLKFACMATSATDAAFAEDSKESISISCPPLSLSSSGCRRAFLCARRPRRRRRRPARSRSTPRRTPRRG